MLNCLLSKNTLFFKTYSLTYGLKKLEKVMEKVMESQGIWRA